MASLPLSFTIQSHCFKSGSTELRKLMPATNCVYGKTLGYNFEKLESQRELFIREEAKFSAIGSSQRRNIKLFAVSGVSGVKTEERSEHYQFSTETGGRMKVVVRKENLKYRVYVEVSSLEMEGGGEDELVMSWGIIRSDSSQFMPLDFKGSAPDSRTIETPFVQKYFGTLAVELEFEGGLAPFNLSFLLKCHLGGDSESLDIRSHRKTNFCVPVGLGSGYPAPLGFSFSADGSVNFALLSRNAEGVVLCLYNDAKAEKPALEIDLDPYFNRTGDVWHLSLDSDLPFVSYGYQRKGVKNKHVVSDPYSKIVGDAHSGSPLKILGKLAGEPTFDWSDDDRPSLPMEKLVVYRVNVNRFTKHKSSKLPNNVAGTFSGVAEKLHHFKDLGVNAILLEPIFSFEEKKGPYFPFHFFSPANPYGPSGDPLATINSMKEMVKRLHANGMEVFLEVVFTHTAEGCSLRELDSPSYYYGSGDEGLEARSVLNSNYPIVQQMILDSLRYWVIEFHVDGFCFINASQLLKGFHGEFLSRPPLIEAIAFDPLLSKAKIIADSWDPSEMVSREVIFPHWKRWAEINAKFCDDVRNFLRGEGLLSDFATRLCGSGDIFLNGRGPAFSFNFIARNFGLPLVDLVSFSSSNLAGQLSWNCGEEGPTNNAAVLERRLKQIRNFLFVLFVSLGVPVLNMGDECGQSSNGSPAYVDRKPFDWNALRTGFGMQTTQFISYLSSLRTRRNDLLQKRSFMKEQNIEWYGRDQSPPKWEDPSSKFLAMRLKVDNSRISSVNGDLFLAFNAADHSESVILPPLQKKMAWFCLVDTALPFPGFFSEEGEPVLEQMAALFTYDVKSHSCVLFEAKGPSS